EVAVIAERREEGDAAAAVGHGVEQAVRGGAGEEQREGAAGAAHGQRRQRRGRGGGGEAKGGTPGGERGTGWGGGAGRAERGGGEGETPRDAQRHGHGRMRENGRHYFFFDEQCIWSVVTMIWQRWSPAL